MIERVNVHVIIFTRNPEFKLLLLKRASPHKFWQPVSGGIEEGEQPYDTIKRELFEETGIQHIKHIYDLDYTYTFQAPISRKWMRDICFAAEIEKVFNVRLSDEHIEHRWCTEKEAKKLLEWKHQLIALDKLLNIIKNTN